MLKKHGRSDDCACSMKFALCALLWVAVMPCSAQQSNLVPVTPQYRVSESPTISVEELQQRSQSKARGIFTKAKEAALRGDHAGAVKLFEKTLKVDPYFADARNDMAVELIVLDEAERAVAELQQLIELQPHFVMGYTNLAAIFCDQDRYAEAEAVLRRVLSIDPNSSKANLLLGIALHEQGKRGEETQNVLEMAARSNLVASKLLKEWFGVTDVAEKDTTH